MLCANCGSIRFASQYTTFAEVRDAGVVATCSATWWPAWMPAAGNPGPATMGDKLSERW